MRLIERYVIDKAKAMDNPCGAVVSLIIGNTSGVLRCLYLLEQIGMVAFFDAEKIAKIVGLEGLDMLGIGTQTVFGDDELEVWVVLVQLGHKTFGGIAFTIIFGRPILLHNRFRRQWNHCAHVRMNNRCTQHLMKI